mgnify:CR=1 FL=1
MILPKKYQNLPQVKKKLILYKFAEIYSDSDELLNFMDNLEWDDINFVFNVVFAWNNIERQEFWNKQNDSLKKMLWKINELSKKINSLIIQEKEFLTTAEDQSVDLNI